jgi:predicted ATPase/DNA-binding CsgD family transcriptional regulator
LFAGLTPQERRVVELVGAGMSNKAVARSLGVAIRTVEFHLGNVYRKLDVASRSELAHLVGRWSSRPHGLGAWRSVPELVDREREIAQVAQALRAHRRVTLRGPGGVGKTSLALAACAPLGDGYADGAWFVDLSAVTDPEDVVAGMCAVLALRPSVAPLDASVVADGLAGQQRLIVLDNCEHVLSVVRRVVDLIGRRCPHVSVLATSRQRLDVAGEHVVAVPPMSLDAAAGTSPAARLFIDRACAIDASFSPSAAERASIEAICRHLDGLPLAIELAASRVFGLGVAELEERLVSALDVVARHGSLPDRHDSLRTAIDWSHQLLTRREQITLATSSVFAGEFDLPAATAVAPPGSIPNDVANDLAGLVEASLLNVVDGAVRRRFRLLETIRAYAAEQLDRYGLGAEVRDRHLCHVAARAHRANEQLRSIDELDGHLAFGRDWADIRQAIATATANDDGAKACALINDVLVWAVTRNRTEAGPWCDAIIELPSVADLPAKIPVIAGAMRFANLAGDVDRALQLLELGRVEEARLGPFPEPILAAFAVFVHRHTTAPAASMRESLVRVHEVQARARSSGSPFWLVLGSTAESGYLGALLRTGGATPDEAAWIPERTAEVMEIADRLGNPYLAASGEIYHALVIDRTDPDRAAQLLVPALAQARRLDLSLLTGPAQTSLALIDSRAGRHLDALAGLRVVLDEHVRSRAITDVLSDLAVTVRPLSALAPADVVDNLVAEIHAAHPAIAAAYRLDPVDPALRRPIHDPTDILETALETVRIIDNLCHD